MKSQGWSLREAVIFLRGKRPVIDPNNGFLRQLVSYERELYGKVSVDEALLVDDYGGATMFIQ